MGNVFKTLYKKKVNIELVRNQELYIYIFKSGFHAIGIVLSLIMYRVDQRGFSFNRVLATGIHGGPS